VQAVNDARILSNHRPHLLQHSIHRLVEANERCLVAQDDRRQHAHVIPQACHLGRKPLQRPTNIGKSIVSPGSPPIAGELRPA